MSNRGNPDYYKVSGTPVELSDVAGAARRLVSQQRAEERRRARRTPPGPQSVPFRVHRPPIYRQPEPPAPMEPLPPAPWNLPSVGAAVRAAARGLYRLSLWTARTTMHHAARWTGRRVRRWWERG